MFVYTSSTSFLHRPFVSDVFYSPFYDSTTILDDFFFNDFMTRIHPIEPRWHVLSVVNIDSSSRRLQKTSLKLQGTDPVCYLKFSWQATAGNESFREFFNNSISTLEAASNKPQEWLSQGKKLVSSAADEFENLQKAEKRLCELRAALIKETTQGSTEKRTKLDELIKKVEQLNLPRTLTQATVEKYSAEAQAFLNQCAAFFAEVIPPAKVAEPIVEKPARKEDIELPKKSPV